MSKELKALEKLTNYKCSCMSEKIECKEIIKKALIDKEKQENALKTISDIIRDFNKGEYAKSDYALEDITSVLKGVLL